MHPTYRTRIRTKRAPSIIRRPCVHLVVVFWVNERANFDIGARPAAQTHGNRVALAERARTPWPRGALPRMRCLFRFECKREVEVIADIPAARATVMQYVSGGRACRFRDKVMSPAPA